MVEYEGASRFGPSMGFTVTVVAAATGSGSTAAFNPSVDPGTPALRLPAPGSVPIHPGRGTGAAFLAIHPDEA